MRAAVYPGRRIYRAESAKGPFKKVALATGATLRDKRPNGQPAWYRVATVNLVGEGPKSEVVCAGAAPTSAKRLPFRTFAAGWVTGFAPMWRGKNSVGPSDDPDRLPSARVPGMRCDPSAHCWSDGSGGIIIPDGRPRRLTIALGRSTIRFTDSETVPTSSPRRWTVRRTGRPATSGISSRAASGSWSRARDSAPCSSTRLRLANKPRYANRLTRHPNG